LVVALLAGGVTGLTSRYWLTFRNDDRNFDIKLPHSPDFAHPSLDMFVALSELVTLRTQLDPLMVQHMYPLFMDEPWGPTISVRATNRSSISSAHRLIQNQRVQTLSGAGWAKAKSGLCRIS
jgi:hypothetical protein